MIPVLVHERCALFHGDSANVGLILRPNTVDAIVTDPPAGISFMGRDWDSDKGGRDEWIRWLADLFRPAFAALKPGGHALVWAIPRTSHWTAMALELAGFEIRDVHHHIFGSGFPKSLTPNSAPIPEGTGTATKPAVEHWILARKPLEGTYAANVEAFRTGVLNIDACRIGTSGGTKSLPGTEPNLKNEVYGEGMGGLPIDPSAELGRWPAHLSLEHALGCNDGESPCVIGCPVRLLDEQSGQIDSHGPTAVVNRAGLGYKSSAKGNAGRVVRDKGGASRFFYIAKPSRKEKDAGLDHLPIVTGGEATGRADGSAGVNNPRAGAGRTGGARNHHPTVKSIALMQWLVRLITPPRGLVLDLFAGSGTTGVAALHEGCEFVGIELTDKYIPITKGRLEEALRNSPPSP